MQIEEQVRSLVAPLLKNLSIDLWDVECKGFKLSILVDTTQGIDIETLSFVSRILSSELDNFEPVAGNYTLEVSSPGLNKTLRHLEHYESSLGSEISIRLNSPIDGEFRIMGVLKDVTESGIEVHSRPLKSQNQPEEAESGQFSKKIPFEAIKKAQILFEWDEKAKEKGVLNG